MVEYCYFSICYDSQYYLACIYSYSWSNGGTTASITGLAAGTYTVDVTDNSTGCTTSCVACLLYTSPSPRD